MGWGGGFRKGDGQDEKGSEGLRETFRVLDRSPSPPPVPSPQTTVGEAGFGCWGGCLESHHGRNRHSPNSYTHARVHTNTYTAHTQLTHPCRLFVQTRVHLYVHPHGHTNDGKHTHAHINTPADASLRTLQVLQVCCLRVQCTSPRRLPAGSGRPRAPGGTWPPARFLSPASLLVFERGRG